MEREFEGLPDASVRTTCPWCGEPVELLLDPGGGPVQAYVEDCEVCCRPWQVQVRWRDGLAEVQVEALE